MSSKVKYHRTEKYLTTKEFIDYCTANRIDASREILEVYEKHGLLFPIYRIIVPEDYVKATFEYQEKKSKDPSIKLGCREEWKPIERLFTALDNYRISNIAVLEETLQYGHPLDIAFKNNNPFVKKPVQLDFLPWQNYHTIAGYAEGQPIKEDLAEHYYAPWQIFIIDELNRMHSIEFNYLTNLQKGYDPLRKEIHQSKILKFSDIFQTVLDYRMLEAIIYSMATRKTNTNIIEEGDLDNLSKQICKIAEDEYFAHPQEDWIRFMQKLVELYNNYLKHEKQNLSHMLKQFLKSTAEMIIVARDIDFEQLCNEYNDGYTGCGMSIIDGIEVYPHGLEEIFPMEAKQLSEHALKVLPGYLKSFYKILPNKFQLHDKLVKQLVLTLTSEGNELILVHLHEIENLWFNRILHWQGSIWAHLRSFATSIETLGKEWYGGYMMGSMLNKAFRDYSKRVKDIYGKCITDAKDPDEFVCKLDEILNKRTVYGDLFGYYVVITHLFRSFSSHYNKKIEPHMLGSRFLNIYECLIFTLMTLYTKHTEKRKNFTETKDKK